MFAVNNKRKSMSKRVAWESAPVSVVASPVGSTVTFRLRNGQTREQGAKLPHTFTLGSTIAVTNRIPTEVGQENGRIVGRWLVPRMRWKTTPQSIQRKSYSTLLVSFEPEEGVAGYARNTDALAAVPHTFTAEGVTMNNERPFKVLTVRGGRSCPCYAVWIVHKPLTEAQWSAQPTAMPWRRWDDRDRVIAEYEFFYPESDTNTDWSSIARATAHSFSVSGVAVSRPPDEVYTLRSGRITGRWSTIVPFMEGFESEDGWGCFLGPNMRSFFLLLLVCLVIFLFVYALNARRKRPGAELIMVRVPITIRPMEI